MPLSRSTARIRRPFFPWIVRRVEVVSGEMQFRMECFPGFNYSRDSHTTTITHEEPLETPNVVGGGHTSGTATVVFDSPSLKLELVAYVTPGDDGKLPNLVFIEDASEPRRKGSGVVSEFCMSEGQKATFVLRPLPEQRPRTATPSPSASLDSLAIETSEEVERAFFSRLTKDFCDDLLYETVDYWLSWVSLSTYTGRWREFVLRSAITLKLLTYQPTGAIIAASTFGLPEAVGGQRNWDCKRRIRLLPQCSLISMGSYHICNITQIAFLGFAIVASLSSEFMNATDLFFQRPLTFVVRCSGWVSRKRPSTPVFYFIYRDLELINCPLFCHLQCFLWYLSSNREKPQGFVLKHSKLIPEFMEERVRCAVSMNPPDISYIRC
jgi:hypothetical protein